MIVLLELTRKKWHHRVLISLAVHCTKMRFVSLLSGGFTTMEIHRKRNCQITPLFTLLHMHAQFGLFMK